MCYASRTLTDVERRYSQTEKEALALVWSCERFHQYLLGRKFALITDHKPLEIIYSTKSKPSARIERWVLRLQPYNFRVQYVRGCSNIADALSRLPTQDSTSEHAAAKQFVDFVRFITTATAPCAIPIKEIERESETDPELRVIWSALQKNALHTLPRSFQAVRNELTAVGMVILRGHRIIPPSSLRAKIVQLAHEGHQGIVKTKERL